MRSYLSLLPLAWQSIMNASTTLLSAPDEFRFPPDPEWKQLLRDDLAKQPVNFFSLATVAEAFVPHVRTMTLKGFFGDVGYSKKSEIPEASRNPAAASDTFFITSHATQQKFQDVALSNQVETVFWIPAVGTQWRVRGHAVVLGGGDSEAAQREMDRHLTKGEGEWTWEREVRKIYDGLDGRARAGFEEPESGEMPKDFRILVIVPEYVEALMQKPVEQTVRWTVEGGEPGAKWAKS